jgi:hypothetical protein
VRSWQTNFDLHFKHADLHSVESWIKLFVKIPRFAAAHIDEAAKHSAFLNKKALMQKCNKKSAIGELTYIMLRK